MSSTWPMPPPWPSRSSSMGRPPLAQGGEWWQGTGDTSNSHRRRPGESEAAALQPPTSSGPFLTQFSRAFSPVQPPSPSSSPLSLLLSPLPHLARTCIVHIMCPRLPDPITGCCLSLTTAAAAMVRARTGARTTTTQTRCATRPTWLPSAVAPPARTPSSPPQPTLALATAMLPPPKQPLAAGSGRLR